MNNTITTTPNKNSTNSAKETHSYSPITLAQNPANASPQKNLTGLPRVAKDIVADIYNNIQKWNDNQVKGMNVVKEISSMKSDAAELFPPDLEKLMRDLYDIVQNLSIYSNALIFLTSQMNALVKLQKATMPLFVTLTVEQLSELAKGISDAYKAEYKVKQYILENIAHSQTKQEIMFFAGSWAHQSNITNNITLKLETLLTETGHRKLV